MSQQSALETLANLCTVGDDEEEWADEASEEDDEDLVDAENGHDEGENRTELVCSFRN